MTASFSPIKWEYLWCESLDDTKAVRGGAEEDGGEAEGRRRGGSKSPQAVKCSRRPWLRSTAVKLTPIKMTADYLKCSFGSDLVVNGEIDDRKVLSDFKSLTFQWNDIDLMKYCADLFTVHLTVTRERLSAGLDLLTCVKTRSPPNEMTTWADVVWEWDRGPKSTAKPFYDWLNHVCVKNLTELMDTTLKGQHFNKNSGINLNQWINFH